MGSEVSIPNIPDMRIMDLPRGAEVDWDIPQADATIFKVNRRKVFAFRMDKMDLKQLADKGMMDKFSDDAAKQMIEAISVDFLNDVVTFADPNNQGIAAGRIQQGYNLGTAGAPVLLSKSNIIDYITAIGAVGDEQKWPDSGRKVFLPSVFCMLLKQSDLKDASMTGDAQSTLRSGRLGMIDRWEIFRSNLYTPVIDVAAGSKRCYNILFNHMEGICYAGQLQEAEYHEKFEKIFGKGMKGENIFDWVVNKPVCVGNLYAAANIQL